MSYDVGKLSPNKRHWIARNSNIPLRFYGRDFDDIRKEANQTHPEIERWVDDALAGDIICKPGGLLTTGVGLLIDGPPGRGKTTIGVTAAMEFVRRLPEDDVEVRKLIHMSNPSDYDMNLRMIYYITATDFIARKKGLFEDDSEARAENQSKVDGLHGRSRNDRYNVRILVFDDAGKEQGSSYDSVSVEELLRSRYDAGLPTILTTNRSRDDWSDRYGKAMASFVYEAFRPVTLEGEDLRSGA
jgi:DNA replication protein DnaC